MSAEMSLGQDMRALTSDRFPEAAGEGGGEASGASGTRITWNEYELYSSGTDTLILFRRGRAIVWIGGIAASSFGEGAPGVRGGVPRDEA